MSDNKTIRFEIVTPERTVLKEQVLSATVPTADGEITVLPSHIPLVSILRPGVIELKNEAGETEIIACSGGFIEVLQDRIVILADTAERAVELDEARVAEAKARAEEIKNNKNSDDVQFAEANALIEKQLARSKALGRWRKLKNL